MINIDNLRKELKSILFYEDNDINLDLLISAQIENSPVSSVSELKTWLRNLNSKQLFDVKQVPLTEMKQWIWDKEIGEIKHKSGGFFRIRGLHLDSQYKEERSWDQPIIFQPEIGILGFIVKKINGILHFLIQAKAEPGNINTFQLSPTVQATRSNFLRLHGGKKTTFLEYFNGDKKARVILDRFQSEQGTRFYNKRNRNIVVLVDENEQIDPGDNFRWMSLGQIIHFNQFDNHVNMDTRSIISCLNLLPEKPVSLNRVDRENLRDCLNSNGFEDEISEYALNNIVSAHPNTTTLKSINQHISNFTNERYKCIINKSFIPLQDMKEWKTSDYSIKRPDNRFYEIMGVEVEASHREVVRWDQPIVKQSNHGVIALLSTMINGTCYYLVQFKMECGLIDNMEMAPTIQCIPTNYRNPESIPFMNYVNSDNSILSDAMQSEEGGRFFREENRNMIINVNNLPEFDESVFALMSLAQLKHFSLFASTLNIELRSVISTIKWR